MSEEWIKCPISKKPRLFKAHDKSHGGHVSGEVKLACTLRCLAGGSYLDLIHIYTLGKAHFYEGVVHKVCREWICNDAILPYFGEKDLDNVEEMKSVAKEFELKGGSKGIMKGVIGALDGWLVRIRKPRLSDGVLNPKGFFNRKGFFAINVQVIGDRKRRILWRSIMCRGAEHDSTAFKRTTLYEKLMEKAAELSELGLYIISDSAYALRSFLLCPYRRTVPYSNEDTFNYFLSRNRIFIECIFGEVDQRWGILWRALQFTLEHNIDIIDSCMRLHNFIVNYILTCSILCFVYTLIC
jgi:hypothetical protein